MADKRENLTGRILNDRYFIMDSIGKGGSGNLYLARDMSLGTMWAVKEIPAGKRMEARILTKLSHPCLPKMVDYVEADGHCCLIMEYIQGKSLEALRQEGHRFRTEEIMDFSLTILDILIYLHSRRPPVLYGDLKPANLVLSQEGRLYLVDFGSAVRGYDDSAPRPCEGTPGYAAPEQYSGHITVRSDLYAFGKTILALLAGSGSFSLPGFFLRNPGLTLFLRKCTQKQEEKRYPDAVCAKASLLRIRHTRRLFVFAEAGGAGALLLILLLIFLPSRHPEPQNPSSPDRSMAFLEQLTEVTSAYYDPSCRSPEGSLFSESCLGESRTRLRQMLSQFQTEDEVSTLLLLLAGIEEAGGNPRLAAGYYEQLLLYQPDNRQALASYGLFLIRNGQKENSLRLWNSSRPSAGHLTDPTGGLILRDEQRWKEKLGITGSSIGN